jgi:phage gpG-like protein
MEDIRGVEFTTYIPAGIKSTEEAVAHLAPLFSPDASVVIAAMEYDYIGEYGQTAQHPVKLEVRDRAWVTLTTEPPQPRDPGRKTSTGT